MPGFLKQSTASQSRALGPFVDETDFKTAETGLTIANTDIKLVVNGAASANKNSGGGTHRVNGVYGVTFDATDTATVGEMEVSVVVAGALPVFDKFFVVEEAVYAMLFEASALGYIANAPVNAAQWNGSAVAAPTVAGVPEVDVTHWIGTAASTPTVAGVPNVNVKTWNDLTTVALPLVPTTAGRALDVSVGGEAGLDWANIGSPTTAQNLSATNIDVDQVVASVSGAVGSVTGAVGSVTGAVGSVTGAVGSVTGAVGSVTGSIGSLAAQAKTDVNVEVVDALATDTYAESATVPAATATLAAKISWLGTLARNKIEQTATTQTVRADDTTTAIATAAVSDNGTTAIRNEFA
jgi:hypothetical protein